MFNPEMMKKYSEVGEKVQNLQQELQRLGLWSREIRDRVIAAGGSVQGIPEIPEDIKLLYRTSWELKQRGLIDMAADRGAFIDQSQVTPRSAP